MTRAGPVVAKLASLVLLVSFAGLFCLSAAETAFASLGSTIRQRLEDDDSITARRITRLLNRPELLLGTIVIGSSLALLCAAGFAVSLAIRITRIQAPAAGIAITGVAFVAVVGEVMTRALASRYAERVASFTAWPMTLAVALMTPLVRSITALARVLVPNGANPFAARGGIITKQELEELITAGEEEGTLETDERRLLHSIFDLSETTVREVMTPRNDVAGLPMDAEYAVIMKTVIDAGYSRMPVYEDTIDQIVGVVYVKDLLTMWDHRELIILHDVMREPVYVPEAKRIDDLLREFQRNRNHMAIVLDEYGGVSGLVTMEDVLEEIVGEIQDEYDEELVPIEELTDGSIRVTGRASLRKVNAEFDAEFPDDAYTTMGGFTQSLFLRIPKAGDSAEAEGWQITVEEMDGRRIARLRLCRLDADGDDADGASPRARAR